MNIEPLNVLRTVSLMVVTACGIAQCVPSHAADVEPLWVAEGVYQTLALADLGTTLDIRKHPGLEEENPILGHHPSDAKVVGYFVASGVTHALVTKGLNAAGYNKTAYAWEALGIGLEAYCVAHNYRLGLHVAF